MKSFNQWLDALFMKALEQRLPNLYNVFVLCWSHANTVTHNFSQTSMENSQTIRAATIHTIHHDFCFKTGRTKDFCRSWTYFFGAFS
jgi:hypothetical protein